MKTTNLTLVVLLMATTAFAANKKHEFNANSHDVFQAALKAAREKHVVTYVDEKQGMITFQSGGSMMSSGFTANASVVSEGDNKSELIVNMQKKNSAQISYGAGGRMADKFYEEVEANLKAATATTTSTAAPSH